MGGVVQRTRLKDANCPVARALDAIGDWWSLLIIRDAFDGARRFSDFQRGLGVSRGILATRLQTLIEQGVLEKALTGVRHEYVLTARGRDLFTIIVALRQWGEDYCFVPGEPRSMLVELGTERPVARLQVQSAAGKPLAVSNTEVRKVGRATPLCRAGQNKAAKKTSVPNAAKNA